MKNWQFFILISVIFSSKFVSETTGIVLSGIYSIIGGIIFIFENKK